MYAAINDVASSVGTTTRTLGRSSATVSSFSRAIPGTNRANWRRNAARRSAAIGTTRPVPAAANAAGVKILCVRPEAKTAWGTTQDVPALTREGYGMMDKSYIKLILKMKFR